MIWKGIVKWKKTIRFALTGSHSVSGVVNFAAGAVFYFTTDNAARSTHVKYSSIALVGPF